MTNIHEEWQKYVTQCFPPDMPEAQNTALLRTFYAGALIAIALMMRGSVQAKNVEDGTENILKLKADVESVLDREKKKIEATNN